ncbi:phosphotransferase enzyme family protein [Streptomyces sp. CMB-StM0423]|uniref:phosphotransferase enzyme family protein n=1 Tax=Streptomyces sp. CMB-StM0423 TaxID=2059884 RepID=UPI000C7082AC|nr:phosphotransferase [Streptomyces sp. CMB-StM0423]AUH39443.1 serine kinase [Streptomyces sp. CMB-StM0423]
MVFVEVPLTAAVREATGVTGPAERLYGGEESAAWRVGAHVVRIGAYDKDTAEAEWCHRVAVAARAGGCPEAVAPLPVPGRDDGATVVRVEGRAVSLWPYADGVWADRDDPRSATAAARMLARLHRALAGARLPPRPKPSFLEAGLAGDAAYDDPRLHDPQLDTWLAGFSARARLRHALHGDYYHGNLLVDRADPARIVAVLDWDESLVAPPEVEVGSAALEFADEFCEDPADARRFADAYLEAGGTAEALDEESLTQLMRHRLRREGAYFALAVARGVQHDGEDLDYHHRRMEAFAGLRP